MKKRTLKILFIFIALAMSASMISCKGDIDTENTFKEESSNISSVNQSKFDESSEITVDSLTSSDASESTLNNQLTSSNNVESQIIESETNNNSSDDKIVSDTTKSSSATSELQTVKITFPEGSTVARIFDILDAEGVAKKADLFAAMESMDISAYPLLQEITPKSSERCFLFEGYLYTSTYDFYLGESAENVLKRFLEQSEKRIKSDYRKRAEDIGYKIDDMIILASMLEKEVHKQSELATVSSIFHNRLNAGQRLQSDATIKYVEGAIKPYITGDINRYNSFYNTYKCKALPAGAICNPSMKALEAALYPAETDYMFFATDSSGNYYYSSTYEEHQSVVEMLE